MTRSKPSYILESIVFVSGAVVMILEITGSRILAPYIGNSLPVWTGLIGIILGSLSLGYFAGGKLADRYPTFRVLSWILCIAALLLSSIPLLSTLFLPLISATIFGVRISVSIAATLLFALPSILLGMVSPYAIRLRLKNLQTSGSLAGKLYALSTIGSIAGTFFAGFFLIATLGSQMIMYCLAVTILLLSLLISGKDFWKILLLAILAISLFKTLETLPNKSLSVLLDRDTHYNHVIIYERRDQTGQPIRELLLGNVRNSATYVNSPELVYDYSKYYRLVDHFVPELSRILVIGGGAYSYPKDFLRTHPQAAMDVVELDPILTEIAQEYFFFAPTKNTRIFHEDGRTFLNREENVYDAIVIDAFSDYAHPFQLTTKEALTHMDNILTNDGVVISNIVSSILGNQGKVLQSEYYTYKSVFPHVAIFPVQNPNNPNVLQNIMLIASKKPMLLTSTNPEFMKSLSTVWKGEVPQNLPILTDNYAPLEYYTMQMFP